MIQVIIKNLSGEQIAMAEFETQELSNFWISKNSTTNAWGKPERWVEESKLKSQNEDPKLAIETAFIDNPYPAPGEPKKITMYKFAKEFSIEIKDLIIDPLQPSRESIEAIAYGTELIASVRTLNKSKMIDGSMTLDQFNKLMADPMSVNIERALWTGSFRTAKQLMSLLNGYYTSDEMAKFNAKIDLFLSKYP